MYNGTLKRLALQKNVICADCTGTVSSSILLAVFSVTDINVGKIECVHYRCVELLALDWLHILFWGSNSHIVIGPVVNPCILLVYVDDISCFSRLNNNILFRVNEMF